MTEKSYRNAFSKVFDWIGFNALLVQHYVSIITERIKEIRAITCYLAVDGYFMKKEFLRPLVKHGLHIITKARHDANLIYIYPGKQKTGKGRPRLYDGKVNTMAIDKRRIKCCYRDKVMTVYTGALYSVQLKQTVLALFIYYGDKEKPEIIKGTDTQMEAISSTFRFHTRRGITPLRFLGQYHPHIAAVVGNKVVYAAFFATGTVNFFHS